MKNYTSIIYKFKPFLIVFIVISIILSLIGLFKVNINTDFAVFGTNDSKYEQTLEELNQSFGNLEQFIIVVEHDSFDETVKDDLQKIQNELSNVPHVLQIEGVAPSEIYINGSLVTFEDATPDMMLTYYENFEEFSPMIKKDGMYYSTFTVFIDEEFSTKEMNDCEDILSKELYDSYISGDIYSQVKISDYILRILLILPPLAMLTILLVFRWKMGGFKPTIFSVLPAGIGSLWTLGLVGWFGGEASILTAVAPIFIIVIGSADGLHFMSHFQDSKLEGDTTFDSITKTLQIVGIPMIITTLTSMVGFLSLLSMNTDSIVDLAIYSSIGIFLAGVATWLILPLILSNEIDVLPKSKKERQSHLENILKKVWGIPSFLVIGMIVLLFLFGYGKINNEFDMLMVYKESTVVSKNAEKVKEVYGGNIPLYIFVKSEEDIITLASKNEIDQFSESLLELDYVTKVVNPYRLLDITFGNEIPNDVVLNNLYSQISVSPTSPIHNLMNSDESKIRLLVFTDNLENKTLLDLETFVSSYDNISISGIQYLLMDLNTSVNTMQLNSILLAITVVFIMMMISLRSIKISFISTLPIIITVLCLYGFLGITQIPLNITTVMIFSITIGVGIDYAVHFSSVYQYYKKQGLNNNEAINLAYKNSSRPIITNALGISLGLSIMMLSPLTIHFNVSILMWVSMIISVFVTLTFIPTILSFDKGGHHAKENVL